jgi:uncharacterized membrane protein
VKKEFYKSWILSLIVLFVVDVLWHALIFAGFYLDTMGDVVRVGSGRVAPMLQFIALGDVIASFGYAYFLAATCSAGGRFVMNGALAGLVIHAPFTLWNYALIPGWDGSLAAFDTVYAVVQGLIQGFLFQWMNRSAEKPRMA